MIAFFKLIRYKNLLMILLTMVLTKYALVHSLTNISYFSNFQFSILAISTILIAAGGYIINDIFDIKADKINKPTQVFIDNFISKDKACFLYYGLTILGLLLGFYVSYTIFQIEYGFIFIFSFIGLFLYSYYFKKKVLLGNIGVSFLCGLPVIISFIFEGETQYNGHDFVHYFDFKSGIIFDLKLVILCYSAFAFLTTLIREIIKDIEDIDGDLQLKAKTLPIVLGRKRAKNVAVVLAIILLISLIQIAKNYLYSFPLLLGYTFIFILVPLSYFTYQLWNAETKKQFHFLSNFMKLIMFLGILSMILFKFM